MKFNEDLYGNESWDECEKIIEFFFFFNFWKLRKLTFTGKVLIIKVVILLIVLSVASVYPGSAWRIRKIERRIFVFFWGGKMEKT